MTYRQFVGIVFAVFCQSLGLTGWCAERQVARGTVKFEPTAEESRIAERFQMTPHSFEWEARRLGADSKTVDVWDVTFPSPVVTDQPRNNTIYGEYYQPKRPGKRPAVIVLHILGGDFPLSRVFCNTLAQHGVAALFIKLPYYGERRDPSSERRMISADADETVAGMTQGILDIRQATAWLAARQEVDADQIGIFGISLGGITGALAACNEPRIQNVCLLLAGGDVAKIPWDSPELQKVRGKLPFNGGTKDVFLSKLTVIDPVTYAAGARGKRVLLLNATDDEVIPRHCTDSLWNAFGQPEIVWYPGGHYSVIRHVFSALDRVSRFFATTAGATEPQAIYRAPAPVTIDGRLDEPCWREAKPIVANHRFGRAGLLSESPPLVARMCWDEHYLYVGYEVHDRDLAVLSPGKESAPAEKLDLVELFIAPETGTEFWEIHHAAGNGLDSAWCRVPARSEWAARGKPEYNDVVFDRARSIPDDGQRSVARAVALMPKTDGKPSTINDCTDVDVGFTAEIRLPLAGLGLLKSPPLQVAGAGSVVATVASTAPSPLGLDVPILVALLQGDSGEAVYDSSAELPKQMFHFSAGRWPRYRFAEKP